MVNFLRHPDHRYGYERYHDRPHALEYLDHDGVVLEIAEQSRNEQDGDERRQDGSDGRDYAAFDSPEPVTGEYGYVYREQSGRRLGQRHYVGHLIVGQPSAPGNFFLDNGNHGVASSYGESSYFGENQKQIFQRDVRPFHDHHMGLNGPDFFSSPFTQPSRPVLSEVSSFSTGAPLLRSSLPKSIQKLASSVVNPK